MIPEDFSQTVGALILLALTVDQGVIEGNRLEVRDVKDASAIVSQLDVKH